MAFQLVNTPDGIVLLGTSGTFVDAVYFFRKPQEQAAQGVDAPVEDEDHLLRAEVHLAACESGLQGGRIARPHLIERLVQFIAKLSHTRTVEHPFSPVKV